MTADREYDVCVVGSGAGGAVAAAVLVEAGLDVVLVEQGDHVPPGTYLHDVIGSYETATARDVDGRWSEAGYPWAACCVGGGTRFYAGVSLRLRTVDFDAAAHVVPEALCPTWPFGYDVLRPHYEWVEARLGVSGDGGADPTAPSQPIGVLPPQQPTPRADAIATAARGLGLRPFPMPLAVATVPFGGAPVCADLTTCTDHVCPSGAKGDVYQRLVAPLLTAPNATLRTRVKAARLVTVRPGRVGRLDAVDLATGRPTAVRARVFVLAANAIQTAALLLRSGRLGDGSGLLGRGLCMKAGQNVRCRVERPVDPLPAPGGGRFVTVGISDFYVDPQAPTGLGGLLFDTGPLDAASRGDPRVLRLECLVADQPLATNRVELHPTRRDASGLPRVVVDYRPHAVDLARLAALRDRAEDILRAAGGRDVAAEPLDFTLGSAHLHGTCRMGTDPRTSVCDPGGRLHDADNVFVADGSLMPYPGAVNPALSIQALAHHVATGIAVSPP